VGLFYLYGSKNQQLGLVDNRKKAGMESYDIFNINGLMTQLVRLKLGAGIEESHWRKRQWINAWTFEKGKKIR
jgi:dipeptidyl-peptidase-3